MSALIAQVSVPSEGLDSGLYMPLYLAAVLYVLLFVFGRVLDGREDDRADTLLDAGFAVLLVAGVYVAVLLLYAISSEFDLIVDAVEIMVIMVAFFAVLVTVLLLIEMLIALAGRGRRKAVAPPGEE